MALLDRLLHWFGRLSALIVMTPLTMGCGREATPASRSADTIVERVSNYPSPSPAPFNRLSQGHEPVTVEQLYTKALLVMAENPRTVGLYLEQFDDGLPNAVTPTMGGHTWWTNLETHRGWKLQKNSAFGNCRILDRNDYRFAWGGEDAMTRVFAKMKKNNMVIYCRQGLPELPLGTWTRLRSAGGWTMQKSELMGHVRIIDSANRTIAIGNEDDVTEFLRKLGGDG